MRAAIQTGRRTIEMRETPPPPRERDEALIRVLACGVCGSDLHPYLDRAEAQSLPDGHEVAGEVLALPAGYTGPTRIGDLVAVDTICLGVACGACALCQAGQAFHCPSRRSRRLGGGFAELIARKPAGLFPVPPGVTPEQVALVEPLAVGVHAIRWACMPAGASVAIVGAGTIGLMALLAARALGAGPVHVLARYPRQAALAEAMGATTVTTADPAHALAHVQAATGGGADLVIETVGGHGDTANQAWELARVQGSVAILGIFPDRVPVDLLRPVIRELRVTFPICYGKIDGRQDFDVALELIAAGRAPVERLVTHRLPLDETPEAFRIAADKSTGSVKVHVTMT